MLTVINSFACDACGAEDTRRFRIPELGVIPKPCPPDGWINLGARHACADCAESIEKAVEGAFVGKGA